MFVTTDKHTCPDVTDVDYLDVIEYPCGCHEGWVVVNDRNRLHVHKCNRHK